MDIANLSSVDNLAIVSATVLAPQVLEFKPVDVIPSWSSDGVTISFNIADIVALTAAAAHPTDGDARQVALSIDRTFFNWFNNLRIAKGEPQAMTMIRRPRSMPTVGDFSGKVHVIYSAAYYLDYIDGTVTAEPPVSS